MIGLMRKDFYSMLLYLRQIAVVLLFITVFNAMTRSTSMVGFMLIFLSLNMVQSCLFVDEKNHWDQYALTMPLLRKDVVKARYVILVLIGLASFALGIASNVVLCLVFRENSLADSVLTTVTVFLFYMLSYTISIPFAYRLSADKARYVMMGVMVGGAAVIGSVLHLFPELKTLAAPALQMLPAIGAAALVFLAAAFVISYKISVAIYEKKEF